MCLDIIDEALLNEGINDPNILKAVFMAGGGGSGKGFVSELMFGIEGLGDKEVSLGKMSAAGLKVVNSDDILEILSALPDVRAKFKELSSLRPGETYDLGKYADMMSPDIQAAIRPAAKKISGSMMRLYMQGRIGLIIDSTGRQADKVTKTKKMLEEVGYDTYMVFVSVPVELALKRNASRARKVPEDVLRDAHKEINQNKGVFKSLFGGHFLEIENKSESSLEDLKKKMWNAGAKLISGPVKNPIGKEWIAAHKRAIQMASTKESVGSESRWDYSLLQDLFEGPTPGMIRHYYRLSKENAYHTCAKCETSVGKYPGRYPKYCTNCGEDLTTQTGYPSRTLREPKTKEDPIQERLHARHTMPQIQSDRVPEFLSWLKTEKGIENRRIMVKAQNLKRSQKELNPEKVKAKMGLGTKKLSEKPIIASKDGYVLDGHHRWAATRELDPDYQMDVIEVDTKIEDLIGAAKEWPGVFYKKVKEATSGLSLSGRATLWDTIQRTCESVHYNGGWSLVPWTRNHRVVTCEAVENGTAILSVTAPCWESYGRTVGRIDLPLDLLSEDLLESRVRSVLDAYYEKSDEVTPLSRRLDEPGVHGNNNGGTPSMGGRGSFLGEVQWPSVKARDLLKALLKMGWEMVRQAGSHLTLKHPNHVPSLVTFAFHKGAEIGRAMLSKVAKQTGLQPHMLESILEGMVVEDVPPLDEASVVAIMNDVLRGAEAHELAQYHDITPDQADAIWAIAGGLMTPKASSNKPQLLADIRSILSESGLSKGAYWTKHKGSEGRPAGKTPWGSETHTKKKGISGALKDIRKKAGVRTHRDEPKEEAGPVVATGPTGKVGASGAGSLPVGVGGDHPIQSQTEYTSTKDTAPSLNPSGSDTGTPSGLRVEDDTKKDAGMDLELMRLYRKALQQVSGSPAQKKTKDEIAKRRKELGIDEIHSSTSGPSFDEVIDGMPWGGGTTKPKWAERLESELQESGGKLRRGTKPGEHRMKVTEDQFVHFTTESRAKEILKTKKLLMDPPYRKSGTDTVDAISLTYGKYVPTVQTDHIEANTREKIVAVVFETNTRPLSGFPEEVKWRQNVNLLSARIIPKESAISLLQKTPESIDDYGEVVVYENLTEVPITLSPRSPTLSHSEMKFLVEDALNEARKLVSGEPADPDPRAKPGTSMKAPEKQRPLNHGISKLSAPALTPPEEKPDLQQAAQDVSDEHRDDEEDSSSGSGKPKGQDKAGSPTPPPGKGTKPVPGNGNGTLSGGKGGATPPEQAVAGQEPDPEELKVGIEVEKEHTSDPVQAEKIARDHLAEDPKYYTKITQSGMVDEPAAKKAAKGLDTSANGEQKPEDGNGEEPPENGDEDSLNGQEEPGVGQKPVPSAAQPVPQGQQGQDMNGQSGVDANGKPLPGQSPGMAQQPQQAVDPVTGQPIPGQVGQVSPGATPGQSKTGMSQTVDLVMGDEDGANDALEWLQRLKFQNSTVDGTTVRVVVSSPAEMLMIQRVAGAFGLELSGLV